MPHAETRAEAERSRGFQAWATKKGGGQRRAARLEEDWERLVTFYAFPTEHWKHPRTTNVVESPFAAVRLRTAAAKRFKKVENARPSSEDSCSSRSRASAGSTRPNCCRRSPRASYTSTESERSG
jgi:transposase-like protein